MYRQSCFLYTYCFFFHIHVSVAVVLVGSFSNDDGNKDVKKAIGLLIKAATLHVHHAFFAARLRHENA